MKAMTSSVTKLRTDSITHMNRTNRDLSRVQSAAKLQGKLFIAAEHFFAVLSLCIILLSMKLAICFIYVGYIAACALLEKDLNLKVQNRLINKCLI